MADAVCRAALDALASRAGVGMAGTARMATHPAMLFGGLIVWIPFWLAWWLSDGFAGMSVAGNWSTFGIWRGEPAHRQAMHGVSPSVGNYLRRRGLSASLNTDDKGRLLLALVVLRLSRKRSFDGQSAFFPSGVIQMR